MNHKKNTLLAAVPLIFVCVNLVYLSVLFPMYSGPPGYDQDPSYLYLFNGLLILDGQGPWQVDHPGTPLQLLCAVGILLARGLFTLTGTHQNLGLIDSVLADTEPYLYVMSCLVLALNAGALYFLGFRVLKASKSVLLAGFCQCSSLAFAMLSPRAAYVAPETLLIFATYCLLGLLAPLIFNRDSAESVDGEYSKKWVGLVCGLGLAVKVTFFPILGLVLLIKSPRKIMVVAGYALASLIVLLLPTYRNFPRFIDWVWNVASHSGIHGSGHGVIVDTSQLVHNLRSLLTWFPALYAVMFVLAGFLVFVLIRALVRGSHNESRSQVFKHVPLRLPVVILLVVGLQTLLVLKHPGAHYMVPVLPLAFIGLAWLFFQLDGAVCETGGLKTWGLSATQCKAILIGIGLMFCAYGLLPTFKQIDRMRIQRVAQQRALNVINAEIDQYPDALVICAFRCTMPKYATALGLLYAPGLSTRPIIRTLLANFYEYNFLAKQLITPGYDTMDVSDIPAELSKNRKVFLVTPKNYPDLDVFKLKLVTASPPLSLYEVTGVSVGSPH